MLSKRAKFSGRKEFVLDEHITVECTYWETPWSWGHYAILYKDGKPTEDEKIVYYNRTWESYTYQSIIHSVLSRHIKKDAKRLEKYRELADAIGAGNVKKELSQFKAIGVMAGIIGTPDTQLKTLETLSNGAITRPDDWDSLTEEEKKERLEKALNSLDA